MKLHRALRMAFVLVSLVFILAGPATAAAFRLEPETIRIGTLFNGADVQVTGEIPAGSEAIVEVEGQRIEEELLRKGRHWDIWMNVGEVDIENAPSVYYALSTAPDAFAPSAGDTVFGYVALRKRASFAGETEGLEWLDIFDEFVALKENQKLYRLDPGALKVTGTSGDRATVTGSFRIPSRIAPGEYKVSLLVVEDGNISSTETTRLGVQMEGMPALLSSLARENAAVYGVLADVVAIGFGFLVGVVFGRLRRRPG